MLEPQAAPLTSPPQAPPPIEFDPATIRPLTSRAPTTGGTIEFDPVQVRPVTPTTTRGVLGDPRKPARMGANPGGELAERAEDVLPWVGAAAGGLIGDAPGAALGGAAGQAARSFSRRLRTGHPADVPPVTNALLGTLPPTATPAEQTTRTMERQVAGVAEAGATQYLGQKVAEGVGRVATGLFRPPPGPDTALMQASEKLGLGLTAPELAGETRLGSVSRRVQSATEYSLSGRAEAEVAREVGRQNAIKGVAQGQEAFKRTGEAFNTVIEQGPAHDMTPYHLEAAKIFGDEIAPKLLDLQSQTLPAQVRQQLLQASQTPGGISPQIALRAIRATKAAIQKGAKEPIPVGSLDTLEKILSTKPVVRFASAAPLRTSLRLIGDKGDSLLGERGTALARHFENRLTEGMSQAYPGWDPIRRLYAKGAQGLEEPAIQNLIGEAPPEILAAAKAHGQRLPVGEEPDAIENLRYINEALKRTARTSSGVQSGWARMYNLFELVSTAGALYKGGPLEAAGVAGVTEVLPGLLSWAAHNPTMTKLLTQGITERNPTQAAALIGRVYGAYEAQHRDVKPLASHDVSHAAVPAGGPQPAPAPVVGQPPPAAPPRP